MFSSDEHFIPDIWYPDLSIFSFNGNQHPSTTLFASLNRRAPNCAIGAVNATIPLFWFQQGMTIFAFVEIGTGILRHGFLSFETAFRAGDC